MCRNRGDLVKNFLPITFIGMIVLNLFLPFGNAFAYDGGLLHGKAINSGTSINDTVSSVISVTDGNEFTYMSLNPVNGKETVLWYKLNTPKKIGAYQIKGSGSGNYYTLSFYDSSKNFLGKVNNPTVISGVKTAIDFDNVSYVALENNSIGNLTVYEFDVFEGEVDFSGGLLDGVEMSFGPQIDSTNFKTKNVTDNDLNTKESLGVKNSTNDTIWYKFPSVVDVSKYQISGGSGLIISFHALDGMQIGSSINLTSNNKIFDIDYKNVKYVAITNNSTLTPFLYEFNVYESSATVIVHDELSNLIVAGTHDSVTLAWNNPSGNVNFTGTKIYKNGSELTTLDKNTDIFVDNDVLPYTTYNYKVTGIYLDGHETSGISQSLTTEKEPIDETLIPPSPVSSLQVGSIEHDSAVLNWVNSADIDLESVNIYVNGVLKENVPLRSTYVLTNLNPNMQYNVAVGLVDLDGNESILVNSIFTTQNYIDMIPPNTPSGLSVEGSSGSLYLFWKRNSESDLAGYNIYVDGEKYNTVLIKNNAFTVPNLDFGVTYDVQISAVDKSGNESPLTFAVSGSPVSQGLPVVETDYKLVDVASGVSSWFTAYWQILAFAIAIPLSFYVASRIKLLFLD